MRLRAGQHRSDLFRCRYVFVTRNPRFVRDARSYCIQSRLITENQESPVIHQRELATIAWLRTGLGAAQTVPRSHLLATCDRVLNLRSEARDAVGQKPGLLTPDKIEQYELLLDQVSARLADQILNNEKVITDENAEQLLEAMRRATAEDEHLQYDQRLKASKAASDKKLKSERELVATAHATANKIAEERDAALAQLNELKNSRINTINRHSPDRRLSENQLTSTPQAGRCASTHTAHSFGERAVLCRNMLIFPSSGRTSPLGWPRTQGNRTLHVGAGSGGGRSSAISRRMSPNKCREMATSAI